MNADKTFISWENAVSWLKQQPEQAKLVTDCYYDDPLTEAADRYWRSEEWREVRTFLAGQSGNALDVGAGRGIASYALAKEDFTVTALEPDPSAIVGGQAIRTLAVENRLPIRVVEKFSEHLPFMDGEFDVVFARAVLHHTKDLEKAGSEFFRVLKPGGVLIAIREHVISHETDLPKFLDIHPLHKLYGGEHAYLLKKYVSAIKCAGFADLQVISPWQSPINYAPHDEKTLKIELARRISLGMPIFSQMINILLSSPSIWSLTKLILDHFDKRPGRLYSFVAKKI